MESRHECFMGEYHMEMSKCDEAFDMVDSTEKSAESPPNWPV